MTASYPIRPITEDELPGVFLVDQHAFPDGPMPEWAVANFLSRLELERTLAAFDGPLVVGGTTAFSFRMRVPGAFAAVAGVSMVAVLPTHRRRGILSALMRRQLAEVSERGEALAALFASEAGIYGRYGYGPASWQVAFRMRGRHGRLAADAPADSGLRLRIAPPQSARAEMAKVHDLTLAERPGLYARTAQWWDRAIGDPDGDGAKTTPLRCLLAEDDTGPRAYALFTTQGHWDRDASLPEGTLDVRELMTTDAAASAALWGNLLNKDLISEFQAGMRPADDPLLHLLADPRRLRPLVSDGLWVRLVDVGRALSQRSYACPVDVVIEVTDEECPQNQGRWRLTAASAMSPAGFGATCDRTTAPADVVLPVRALGAAYLGGTRLGPMAAAGLVTEVSPGSLAVLSTAMSWDPAPWCPLIF